MVNETNYTLNNKEIGNRIRIERERLKLTREAFAEFVDLSALYVGQLERGERQMSLPALVNISKYLMLNTDYLLFGNETLDKNNALIKENFKEYVKDDNLLDLLSKCSAKELTLVEQLVKTILPYIK